MLFLRIVGNDGGVLDITTGDEISMAQVFEGIKDCSGKFTIEGRTVTYIIDMSEVAQWSAVTYEPGS